MFLYELPTTGAISFSDFCTDQSTRKEYTYHIPEATQARANLRGALKEAKRTAHNEKDFLQLVKLLEEYLPQLRGMMACLAHDEIGLSSEPTFSWRTTLSANLFNASPRIPFPRFHADLVFTLLTHAFSLSNLALSNVVSLGPYEHDRAISDTERKAKDEQLNVAVNFLCKASGIFTYISDTTLLEWETSREGGMMGLNRPPELRREVNIALAKMSLADAQSLAIRKLLSRSAYDSNIAPGPPLPKSHPSPALVAKLHLECASLYSSARSLAKTSGANKGSSLSTDAHGEVSTELRKYLLDEAAFHNALARKWLGVDAGENGGRDKGGEAVAFLAWAKKELEELKDGGKGVSFGKGDKEKKGRKKERVADELESVNVFFKHYKKINDSLHFQTVPTQMDLQARIPAGRLAIAAKPFVLPVPAFGPGSIEHIRRQAEELEVLDGSSEGKNPPETISSPPTAGSYAGAGAYF